MVVFEDGKPKNADYRSFNITSLGKGEIDDFASLEEATRRRLLRLPSKILGQENWGIKKLTTKKDFSLVIPEWSEGESHRERPKIQSQVFFDAQKKNQKKIEAHFYALSTKDTTSKKIRKF